MGNYTGIKLQNIADLLKALYIKKIATRSELAQLLDVSLVTVYNLIEELISARLCVDSGGYLSSGGRNAALYQVNKDFGYIIGINLRRKSIHVIIANLFMEPLYEEIQEFDMSDVMGCVGIIRRTVLSAIVKTGINNYIGVGVTIPGRSSRHGIVINIPDYPEWRALPLGRLLREALKLPVFIDNDNNAAALYLKWSGKAENFKSYVQLSTTEGVGIGMIVNGSLFYGDNGNGCEIGHISINPEGPLCKCGGRGCLQSYASNEALARRLAEAGYKNIKAAVGAIKSGDNEPLADLFYPTVDFVALTVANIMKLYDPTAIFIYNDWIAELPELYDYIMSAVYNKCGAIRTENTRIIALNDQRVLDLAPVCIILERFFTVGQIQKTLAQNSGR